MYVYRTGNCWGVTIVRSNAGEEPDEHGRRPHDVLLATAQTREHATLIVNALNAWTDLR